MKTILKITLIAAAAAVVFLSGVFTGTKVESQRHFYMVDELEWEGNMYFKVDDLRSTTYYKGIEVNREDIDFGGFFTTF